MAETNDLETMFVFFSKFGDPEADGKTITLSQNDKWMRHAKVLDMKTVTTTDTGVCFNKFRYKNNVHQVCMDELSKSQQFKTIIFICF